MYNNTDKTFTIDRLDAGDKITIEFSGHYFSNTWHGGNCTMSSTNTSKSENSTLTSGEEFTVNTAGSVSILCNNYTTIKKITIITAHTAVYEIVDAAGGGQTFRFISGGVLADKRAAVQYMTMSFGNLKDLTYVKKMPSDHFAATSVVSADDDFSVCTHSHYTTEVKENLPGKEYTVFKGNDNTTFEPIYGSYYYFYPNVDGEMTIRVYTKANTNDDPLCFFDRTAGTADVVVPASNGSTVYTIQRNVKKDHAYYLCSNPLAMHLLPVHSLIDYTFVPDFEISSLYGILSNGATSSSGTELAQVTHTSGVTLGYRNIKYEGNITGANVDFVVEDGVSKLQFSNITYKSGERVNQGGVVIAEIYGTKSDGNGGTIEVGSAKFVLTVAYSAENYDGTGKEVKKWDFYTDVLAIGRYQDTGSTLQQETDKEDADWLNTYMNLHTNEEPIFKSVYDMEGDNADMIKETEGLIFIAKSNKMGIWNENEKSPAAPNAVVRDRYVGMMNSAKMIIPDLKAGDRVRIHMGRYGGFSNSDEASAHLTIENGKDVRLVSGVENGTVISGTGTYVVGGTIPKVNTLGELTLQGVYNFVVNADGNFSITMEEGQLLKLYDIQIYKNGEIIQDNSVMKVGTSNYEILFTSEDAADATKEMHYNMHYRGKAEPIELLHVDNVSGNLSPLNVNSFTYGQAKGYNENFYRNVKKGDFGSYRVAVGVKTQNNVYVTDYARRTMAVGFRETKTYPYTWDFTDWSSYTEAITTELNNSSLGSDHKTWSVNGIDKAYLRQVTTDETGILFAKGGQLYASNHMFPETAGLGFKRVESANGGINSCMGNVRSTDEGLFLDSRVDGTYEKIVVPQVDVNAAIYVRATLISEASAYKKELYSLNGEVDEPTSIVIGSNSYSKKFAAGGDMIYVVKNTSGEKKDIELWLNGMTIKRIAVSTAPKTVNKYGWATESREYDIDPELTSYMTGQNFTTFLVIDVDYPNKKVITTPIYDNEHNFNFRMPYAEATGDRNKNACIIYNNAGTSVDIIDGGFHLFVPDMHEGDNVAGEGEPEAARKPYADTSTSQMKAKLSSEGVVLASEGAYTNFAFTYLYHDTEDGSIPSGTTLTDGGQAFYRIATGGATSVGHQGYLPLLTANIPNDVMSGSRGFTVSFGNDDLTGVELVQNMVPKADVYYNLNGQQLNGQPSRQGLYIVNGKKMYVK